MNVMFNAYAVSDQKWGKSVSPVVRCGLKEWPVESVTAHVEVGSDKSRMTATRVLAGGVLLGPAGAILGGLARKDVTKGHLTLNLDGEKSVVEFHGHDLEKALAFVQALDEAAGRTGEPAAPPPPAAPAHWNTDPFGRHHLRWWDGKRWTKHVSDAGQQSIDPLT